ncbi:purine-nucleoside phosphorylase [Clostridium botulinum]|uniref:Purine nucleoside phosphorylase DeoD-type n=1 Tax=Clostridium botulinum TaxID=1491 RepID=A0A9Q1UX69_CLOBO|nr:purine-nucleoside phosphorylase [Clostridium botulinum]AEB76285.1 purine nucleoside phosphorylase [Clostridium botulinum BKT015925]KEH99989.1 purine nucleoside phosphorylase DeoD-type [Clostridium botulinum D str. 16868]KEI04253.1 purine nucleoside phosphorylase DeoD-type [Clostridium botulinum C/D str. Sp77]KLU75805.1 purine nucleoside phosphorylase DeoD-type [Clostridium botulinum V891]KOA75013.1 purine nucleoside phosphorylase DeoD-type [Clostridium botulinum]
MSVHIEAKENEIAETVLLPGDPLRAKFIAENFLEDVICYNKVRGMYGFTGTYRGKRVSVQGSGMGIPSMSIYANELIESYGVKNLIRVGTCGSINKDVKVRDIILAMGACTNSGTNRIRFNGMDFAPIASFSLLKKAYDIALNKGLSVKVGNILSSDLFYNDDKDAISLWSKYGVLGIEMEASGLYTLGAKYGVNTLTILTVSDSIITGEETTAKERETTFTKMMEIALEIAE